MAVIGTSIAYHLSHLGWGDTVLIERDQLTSLTWHAAGLMVTFGSTSTTSTELPPTRDLYTSLESETGLARDSNRSVMLATDAGRLEEYRRGLH